VTAERVLGTALAVVLGLLVIIEPVAAQEFSGGTEIESFLQSFLPWALRWMLVIGTIIGVFAHIYAGWTSDPDKAFRRKEWRNRALGGVALAIPALIIMNSIITTFGGQPIDFLPFV
jgi:heme/copper-type cytochrome/quinol oxidase subunit 2